VVERRKQSFKSPMREAMKAIVIHHYGGPEVLKLEDYADPVAGTGEVLVRVAAASINPVDTFERAGLTKDYKPVKFPGVLGWDLAGTVVAVGPGAEAFSVGDKVLAWAYHTYAELCAVKTELLAKVPEALDLVEAAALPLVTATGSQLISVASGLKAGQTVLVSGALGGVGRSAVFTAKDRGGLVIAGVRKTQLEAAMSLGADQVVAIDDNNALDAITPVDVVANTVRGTTAQRLLGKVKQGGVYASVTGAPDNAKDFPSIRIIPFVSKQDASGLLRMAQAVSSGKLVIPIDRRLPLKDAAQGHAAVEKGVAGKVLLLP
jgi:NADPH:quinone reductase-like Zn-dependent oxidoreductase